MSKIFFFKNQKCSPLDNWRLGQIQLESLTNKKLPANLDFSYQQKWR